MTDPNTFTPSERCQTGQGVLRILATSDIHAHLLAYDYAQGHTVKTCGLTRTATLIKAARAEVPGAILLDNGDFFQGSPIADLFADPPDDTTPHPVLKAMAHLNYDAIGLGNHEFNFGLAALKRAGDLSQAPFLCANVLSHKASDPCDDRPWLAPSTILTRNIIDPLSGQSHPVRIAVLSVLPPQVVNWDGVHLKGKVESRDMVETVRAYMPALRAQGADIIVLLAHTGINHDPEPSNAENAALPLAAIPGIDAIITGHTHQVFPHPRHTAKAGVDHAAGTLSGTPAVMPGHRGSHLGVIDLHLGRENGRWIVRDHCSEVRSVYNAQSGQSVPEDGALKACIAPGHNAIVRDMSKLIGHTKRAIHSYLSLVQSDLATRLVAEAQREEIRRRLRGGPFEHLPLLSAVAPFQTGGRAGPSAYTDIPAGPLTKRNLFDLYPFPNALCAATITGADVMDWLERAMSCYNQILPGQGDQPLLDPEFPGHAVDTILGLTYRVDLSCQPAYDHKGKRLLPRTAPPRLRDVFYNGMPIRSDDVFVIALNSYRAFGGGPYRAQPQERCILRLPDLGRCALAQYMQGSGADRVSPTPCWSFLPVPDARGLFKTGPGLANHPKDMAALGLSQPRISDEGFWELCLPLDRTACESAA